MLTVTEIPHRGQERTWTAKSREDFCLKLLEAYPRSDLDPTATFDEMVSWLRDGLRELTIVEG